MSGESVQYRPCDECGNAVPIDTHGLDGIFSAIFSHVCDPCQVKTEAEAARREREAEAAAREALIDRMIPPALRRTDIDHPRFNRKAWYEVEKWSPLSGRWLVLLGETGMCKTRMAALHAIRAIRQGYSVEWATSMAFADAARDENARDSAAKRDARASLRRWQNCKVLVLDDFGKEAGDGRRGMAITTERAYFRLFDHRLLHDLPVILSCNTHPSDMLAAGMFTKDRGAPIVGRILEAAGEVLHLVPEEGTERQEDLL